METEENQPKKRQKRLSKREWIQAQNEKPFGVKEILEYLMYLLKDRDYTSGKLLEKLRLHDRFKRDSQEHQAAIDQLVDWGYLNDEAYLTRLVENLMTQSLGLGKIREKLYNKRFSSALIEQGVAMAKEKDFFPDALRAKIKKYGEAPITDPKIKQRGLGFLVRKGFSFEHAQRALSMTKEDQDAYYDEQW